MEVTYQPQRRNAGIRRGGEAAGLPPYPATTLAIGEACIHSLTRDEM
jgi:hypothetical protein